MKNTPSNQEFKAFVEKQVSKHILHYFKHVPRTDDKIITFLKSHLLIEQQLIKLINIELKKPEALSDSRLTFHQILCLAESLHWYKKDDWVWIGIRQLNKIRNSLSHKLEPKNLERDINHFLRLIERKCPQRVKEGLRGQANSRLTLTIGLLYSYISGYLEACINTKIREQHKENNLV